MNADTAESPFHGFFNLFWLGTAIYCVQLLAYNYQKHGNPLGSNEIIGLMFRRDVMVLGLSDGVLCAATGFGLVLQQLIYRGLISWNKEGWIIQSVSAISQHCSSFADNFLDMGIILHVRCLMVDSIPGMASLA